MVRGGGRIYVVYERTILMRAAPLTKWGPWTDTMKLAKARYPRLPSYALGDLCEMFGLVPQIEGRTWPTDRILFGTDFPWESYTEAIRWVKSVRDPKDWDALFENNAKSLLNL